MVVVASKDAAGEVRKELFSPEILKGNAAVLMKWCGADPPPPPPPPPPHLPVPPPRRPRPLPHGTAVLQLTWRPHGGEIEHVCPASGGATDPTVERN